VTPAGGGSPAVLSWRTARRSLTLDRAAVVGILNVTPDSFSDGGRHFAAADAVAAARAMQAAGADIIDVGGESTRPGARQPEEAEELRRVIPVIEQIAGQGGGGVPVSVDTRRASVARAALAAGAEIVNDVSALTHDAGMAAVVAEAGAGLILMHMRGTPETMDEHARYGDVVAEVCAELVARRDAAVAAGIKPQAIVLDPGLGFAKTTRHNLTLIDQVPRIAALGHPVLLGPSRKRFLGALTGKDAPERDPATAAACVVGRLRGAHLFRVHDVASAREALNVADAILAAGVQATSDQRPATPL
jgi:dihydropteroate synthase